jgi:hypothetical protein
MQVEQNPGSYEAHEALVTLLARARLAEEAEQARRDMSARFPLPPQMWRQWIADRVR